MNRRSGAYRSLLILGTVVGLAVAIYLAWQLLRKTNAGDALAESEQVYDRGVEALVAGDHARAESSFDRAISLVDNSLVRIEQMAAKAKSKEEQTKLEAARGLAYWVKARAVRDRAYAKAASAGKPIPDALDTTTRERYRPFTAIPDDARKEAIQSLDAAMARLPGHPDVVRDVLRFHLVRDPIPWSAVIPLARLTLEKAPDDARANYLLARVEFEQFDDKGQPTAAEKRDPARVLAAQRYLAASKKSGKFPLWRTLDLEASILTWLATAPAEKRVGFDPAAEAERLRQLLFDPKTGALARAEARESFDGWSKFDISGIVDLHRLAVRQSIATRDMKQLFATLRRQLGMSRQMLTEPQATAQYGEIIDVLAESASEARTEAIKSPGEWAPYHDELEVLCRSAAERKLCWAGASMRLAEMRLVEGEPGEAKAIEWLTVAANWPRTPPDLKAKVHAKLIALKFARGVEDADLAGDLKALAELSVPQAIAARTFFAGAIAERAGKLDEAFLRFAQSSGVEKGGETVVQSYAALPALALVRGKSIDSVNFSRELDAGWNLLAKLDRSGRLFTDRFVRTREESSAIAVMAYYQAARARVERDRNEKNKPSPEATRSSERAAEAILAKLSPKSDVALSARIAQLEFYSFANREEDARRAAESLRADFPMAGKAILRAELPGTNVPVRKSADERARSINDKLFWAEWLASTDRTALAVAELEASPDATAKALAKLLPKVDAATGAQLIAALTDEPARTTYERTLAARVRLALVAWAENKPEQASRHLQSVAEANLWKRTAESARKAIDATGR